MERSLTLIDAQIQFLNTRLALIHIPLDLYPYFIHPILRLLALVGVEGKDVEGLPRRPWAFYFPFANISVTTTECSIVCPRHLVQEFFEPMLGRLDKKAQDSVSVSQDDFVVIQVGGQGLEPGQRVLDLTAPLALAGISIYFITSYFSDFILVPQKSRSAVVSALEAQGFAFEPQRDGHSYNMTNISSPLSHHHRNTSTTSSTASAFDFHPSHFQPSTPPPTSIAEWQTRTFATLKRASIRPQIDPSLRLATCAGHRGNAETTDRLLYGLHRCLVAGSDGQNGVSPPRFLSITLTEADSASVTLERRLLSLFPQPGNKDVLLRAEETVVPIVLDLRDLTDESTTGIVCGVAGRLIERMQMSRVRDGSSRETAPPATVDAVFNMSYLSTAKAGNVLVSEEEADQALEALEEMERGLMMDE